VTAVVRTDECVVVLDRDGTINVDRHYLRDPSLVELLPGSAAALRKLNELGFRVVVVTNQSGVGRGLMTLADVEAVNRELQRMVEEEGGRLDAIYLCPHVPGEGCKCRKPGTGLLESAAIDLQFDPSRSFVVGDKCSDIEMGRRAGAATILICAPGAAAVDESQPDFVAADLLEAANIIVRKASLPRRRGASQ
jgi:D-glycero-D-manno-heptose 1,7-bisphosphate phosphatase